jgi:hypothetical protein
MRFLQVALLLFIALPSGAQLGGNTIYQFLNRQPNARVSTLGGSPVSNPSNDVNLGLVNPALLNK